MCNIKPPRHYILVYFCDRRGNISAIKANNGPERPKIAIFSQNRPSFGQESQLWQSVRKVLVLHHRKSHQGFSFLVGHGAKWAKKTNIWPKMTKNTTLGPKLAVFGPIIAELLLLLPKFCRTQISLLGSVLTTFGSKSHHSPWAGVSQLFFLKNDQIYHLGPKFAVFGLILAKLSLCLSYAAPKFYSWDLFWLFLVAKLIITNKQAWASSFFLKMTKYTTLGPKLAVLGLILAKLSLCLTFAAPKFHSGICFDCFW